MLIRQKAGWRLHHQAYLWPRRNRSAVPASTSTVLQQPRRARGAGNDATKPTDGISASTLSTRRRNSSSSSVDADIPSPLSWTFSSPRNRQGSEGSCDSSYPSSTSSSILSSRKRSLSSNADEDDADALSTGASARTTRGSCSSIDPILQEDDYQVPHKRRRRSSGTVNLGDELRGSLSSRASSSRDDNCDDDGNEGDDAGTTTRASCYIRHEPCSTSTRTLRDTRKRACKVTEPAVPVCNPSSYSTLNGSDNNYFNFSGSICKNGNIFISHSVPVSSLSKESIRESSSRNSHSKSSPGASRLAEVHAKKEGKEKNGSCEVIPTSIFLRSRMPSFSQSLFGNNNGSVQTKHADVSSNYNLDHSESSYNPNDSESSYNLDDSRSSYNLDDSRSSYNLDDSGSFYNPDNSSTTVMPRRTQRTLPARPVNVNVGQMISKEKMNLDIPANLSENGLKPKSTVIVENLDHIHQRGNQMCCFDLDVKSGHDECVAGQNSVPLSASILSRSLTLPLTTSPASSSNPCPRYNVRANNNIHLNPNFLPTAGVSYPLSNSSLSGCNRAQPVTSKANSTKTSQLPPPTLTFSVSSLSSLSASASQQRFHHNFTQGSDLPSVGSTSSSSSSNYDKDENCSISKCSSTHTSLSSTSVNLRKRTPSGNNPQVSFSQPASPLSLTPSSSKSEPLLRMPSSSPPLSNIANEPPLPIQSSAVPCRWRGCSSELDASDLLEHIRKHVEAQIEKKSYACFWAECKVFNKPSWSCSWLERHIVSHSGHRPFKCILDNCSQRFHSQAVLERHVNGHFTANGQTGAKSVRARDDVNPRMIYKRKRQLKCRFSQTVKMNDFFDEQTMAVVKQELQSIAGHSRPDFTGIALHITFRGLIVGRRSTVSGPKQSLVEFMPGDMLEDKWVSEEEARQMFELSIPLSGLPNNTAGSLYNSLYRRHRFRKHRRK